MAVPAATLTDTIHAGTKFLQIKLEGRGTANIETVEKTLEEWTAVV